jgi:hypothetical protein
MPLAVYNQLFLEVKMIKNVSALLVAFSMGLTPFANAQQQNSSSSSTTASSTASSTASAASGAAVGGVTTGTIVSVAAAGLAVAAALSSSKADPVYTYSNTTGTTVTICIKNC